MGDYVEHLISQAGGDGEPEPAALLPLRARLRAALSEHEPAGTPWQGVRCSCFNWRPGESWLEHIEDVLDALELPNDAD